MNRIEKLLRDAKNEAHDVTEGDPYIDYDLIRRANRFYLKNRFSLALSVIYGFACALYVRSICAVLNLNGAFADPAKCAARLSETLDRIMEWFSSPEIMLKSVKRVRRLHQASNGRALSNGLPKMNQFQMVFAQFSLAGPILACPEKIGLHNISDQDLEAFAHLTYVIGFYLGIRDKIFFGIPLILKLHATIK